MLNPPGLSGEPHFALILLFLFIIHYTFPIICCLAKHLKNKADSLTRISLNVL